jgi:thiol-disulfide isomerase/thioredoxin
MSARTVKGFVKGLALAAAFVLPAFAATSSGPAPTFQLSGRDGKTIDLAKYKGQVVMINFWATWCDPCRKEMPLLEDIYKKYKPMGFTLIGVNVEPKTGDPEGWLSKLPKPVTFLVAFDVDSKVSKLYKVVGMPTTVFIDRKGNVREVHISYKTGDENLYLSQIRSLLKE